MDDASTDVILTLQLQDLFSFHESESNETAAQETPDAQLAVELYKEQLRQTADDLTDQRYGQTVNRAVATQSRPTSPQPSATPSFDKAYSQLMAYSQGISSATQAAPQESELAEPGPGAQIFYDPMIACTICGDAKAQDDLMAAPCDHKYCGECINELFSRAAKDESLFPPHCCHQEISLNHAESLLRRKIYERFQGVQEEFSTVNRTYCHNPDCNKFVSPKSVIGDRAKCEACQDITCTICKAAMHSGDCPDDPAVRSMMKASADAGYRQCYSCNRMIELNFGCFHITCVKSPQKNHGLWLTRYSCLCRAEFCYSCGAKWKTCECPMFDEDALLVEAEELVEREAQDAEGATMDVEEAQANIRQFEEFMVAHARVGMIAPPVVDLPQNRREVLIMEAAARIRLQAMCEHLDWRPVGVRGKSQRGNGQRCDLCRQTLANYLLECTQCWVRTCVRCRRSRLGGARVQG